MLLLLRRAPAPLILGVATTIGIAGLVGFGATADVRHLSVGMETAGFSYFTGTSYLALVQYRVAAQEAMVDIQIPMALVMFFIGLVVGRAGLLEQPDRYPPFLSRWWKVASPVGLAGMALAIRDLVAAPAATSQSLNPAPRARNLRPVATLERPCADRKLRP